MRLSLLSYKPIGITLIYLILGLLWITTSDQIAYLWFGESTMSLTSAQLLKGIFFILITSFILYLLMRRLYNRLIVYKSDLVSIFANPKLAYVKLSDRGKVEEVSDSIKKITGFTKPDIVNKYFFEHIPSTDTDIHEKILRLRNSGEADTMSLETQLKTKDNDWIWVEINASLQKTKEDHLLLSIHDISDRKKAEQKLNQELREKNALINTTDSMIYSVDQNLEIVSFNSAFANAFKIATKREVKRGDSAILDEYPQNEQRKWRKFYERSLSGEEFMSKELIQVGEDVIIVETSFYPILENNNIVGVSVFAKDITEEVKTRESLRQKEEYLQVITDHANEAVIACDMEGKVQYVNRTLKKWLNDESPEEDLRKWGEKYQLYSRKNNKQLSEEEVPPLQFLKNLAQNEFELEIRDTSSSTRIIKSSGSAIFDANDQKIGAMSLWSDVTYIIEREVQISNATLEALEAERSAIASELHDNLTQLLGTVNMNLKNLGLEESEIKNNLRYITAKSRLEKAIEEVRNTAYRITPKSITDFGLVVSIKEMLEDYQSSNELEIQFDHNDDRRINGEIELNLFRITQEALNNVVKHSEANEVDIALFFDDENQMIHLNIEDDGKGFDPANIENGLGLRTMKTRAHKLNGVFHFGKKGSNGMLMQVKIPLNHE